MIRATFIFLFCGFCFLSAISQNVTKDLYVFDFGLEGMPIDERTKFLVDLGYKGVTFTVTNDNQLNKLSTYLNTDEVKSGALTIPVTYYVHNYDGSIDSGNNPRWKKVLNALPDETDFWVIVGKNGTRQKTKDLLFSMSQEAKKINKEIIIYPHDGHFIDNAEDAVSYIEELNLDNVYVTVHMCHELREGNGNRMQEVLTNVSPYLKYISVSGALNVINDGSSNWEDSIRPLDDSEYDLENYVSILQNANYSGGVVLHTFGIKRDPADHLSASRAVWTDLVAKTSTLSINDNDFDSTEQSETIILSPIPADDIILVSLEKSKNVELSIFNLFGQQLYQQKFYTKENSIPVHNLHPGRYVLKIAIDGHNEIRSFVKS